jgi:hypothetical protein
MEDESNSDAKSNKATVITRAWRQGGPFTPEQRKEAMALFIEWLKKDPTVMLACEYANINRTTAYRWKDKYSTFADEWGDAIERTHDVARSSIYTRGILGWEEKVVSNGQLVYEYEHAVDEEGNQRYDERGKPVVKGGQPLLQRKYSDSLAALYAKANLPEYKDKPQLNINAQLGDLAEKAKQELIADIEASIASEDKKQAHPTEPHF